MASFKVFNFKTLGVFTIWLCVACFFVSTSGEPVNKKSDVEETSDNLDINALPPNVAQIVEAISNVQKNVSTTPSKRKQPNIKVATSIRKDATNNSQNTSNFDDISELELQLFEPDESLFPPRLEEKNPEVNKTYEESTRATEKPSSHEEYTTTSEKPSTHEEPPTTSEKPSTPVPVIRDSDVISNVVAESSAQIVETQASNSGQETPSHAENTPVVSYDPPATGLLSLEGLNQWWNWVVSMRDPNISPDGPMSWPTIIGRGVTGIIRHYNPLRRIFGRSMREPVDTLSVDHPYPYKVLRAIERKEITADTESVNAFMHKLQQNKVAQKISEMSRADTASSSDTNTTSRAEATTDVAEDTTAIPFFSIRQLTGPIKNLIQAIRNASLDLETAIFSPIHVVPDTVHQSADMFDHPVSGLIRVPFYVKLVNILLTSLYILIPLIYIPYSGIDNFFLAPLPPDMDTLPGMLRFFGLQAMLGPDYLYDYDYEEEPAEAAAASPPAPAAEEEEEEEDYEEDVRRKDTVPTKTKKFKKRRRLKKKSKDNEGEAEHEKLRDTLSTNLASKMRPPPSEYSGYSSYSSIMATEDTKPVYIYPSGNIEANDESVVNAPSLQDHFDQWKRKDWAEMTLRSSVAASSPVLLGPDTPPFLDIENSMPILFRGENVNIPSPVLSNQKQPIVSAVQLETPKLAANSFSSQGYQTLTTPSGRPSVIYNENHKALFAHLDEVRENYLVTPKYADSVASELRSSSLNASKTQTSDSLAAITTSILRPVYVPPTTVRAANGPVTRYT